MFITATLSAIWRTTARSCETKRIDQTGLHIAINLNHDIPNEWKLFKQDSTVGLKIDKSRLPYMALPIDTEIEYVIFVARVKDNPTAFTTLIFTRELAYRLTAASLPQA